MLIFLTSLHCFKAYHRSDHSILSLDIVRNYYPQPSIFTETRTQESFRVCDLCFCNLLAETNNFVLCAVLLSCFVSELQEPPSPIIEPSFDPSVFPHGLKE
jgi:hypothetical protein